MSEYFIRSENDGGAGRQPKLSVIIQFHHRLPQTSCLPETADRQTLGNSMEFLDQSVEGWGCGSYANGFKHREGYLRESNYIYGFTSEIRGQNEEPTE